MNLRTEVVDIDDVRHTLQQMGVKGLTAYTPTWTAAGGGTSLGNGTLTAFYATMIGFCWFELTWIAGGTTAFGTGIYSFSIPIPNLCTDRVEGSAHLYHANHYSGTCLIEASASTLQLVGASATGEVAHNVPWTWANGDVINATIWYPIS